MPIRRITSKSDNSRPTSSSSLEKVKYHILGRVIVNEEGCDSIQPSEELSDRPDRRHPSNFLGVPRPPKYYMIKVKGIAREPKNDYRIDDCPQEYKRRKRDLPELNYRISVFHKTKCAYDLIDFFYKNREKQHIKQALADTTINFTKIKHVKEEPTGDWIKENLDSDQFIDLKTEKKSEMQLTFERCSFCDKKFYSHELYDSHKNRCPYRNKDREISACSTSKSKCSSSTSIVHASTRKHIIKIMNDDTKNYDNQNVNFLDLSSDEESEYRQFRKDRAKRDCRSGNNASYYNDYNEEDRLFHMEEIYEFCMDEMGGVDLDGVDVSNLTFEEFDYQYCDEMDEFLNYKDWYYEEMNQQTDFLRNREIEYELTRVADTTNTTTDTGDVVYDTTQTTASMDTTVEDARLIIAARREETSDADAMTDQTQTATTDEDGDMTIIRNDTSDHEDLEYSRETIVASSNDGNAEVIDLTDFQEEVEEEEQMEREREHVRQLANSRDNNNNHNRTYTAQQVADLATLDYLENDEFDFEGSDDDNDGGLDLGDFSSASQDSEPGIAVGAASGDRPERDSHREIPPLTSLSRRAGDIGAADEWHFIPLNSSLDVTEEENGEMEREEGEIGSGTEEENEAVLNGTGHDVPDIEMAQVAEATGTSSSESETTLVEDNEWHSDFFDDDPGWIF